MVNAAQSFQRDNKTETALVIGAGISGLLAARVLSDYFDNVTLIEKDIFPAAGENRKSVPQRFLNAVKELPSNEIYDVITNAEPVSDPVSYKFPANLRRYYEKLSGFPKGYIVMGDALCSFNPIYGQGMTVAALEAEALDECLKKKPNNPAADFYSLAVKIIDLSWNSAVGSDLSYPEVNGKRTVMTRFLNWYISKLHIAAHNDAAVSIAFLKVINMVADPPSILNPEIIWRIVKGNLFHGPGLSNR